MPTTPLRLGSPAWFLLSHPEPKLFGWPANNPPSVHLRVSHVTGNRSARRPILPLPDSIASAPADGLELLVDASLASSFPLPLHSELVLLEKSTGLGNGTKQPPYPHGKRYAKSGDSRFHHPYPVLFSTVLRGPCFDPRRTYLGSHSTTGLVNRPTSFSCARLRRLRERLELAGSHARIAATGGAMDLSGSRSW